MKLFKGFSYIYDNITVKQLIDSTINSTINNEVTICLIV